jgi:O-antigen/teichoic acid export membrane protein
MVSFAILARIITPQEVGILSVLSLVTALSLAIVGSAFQDSASKFIGELSDQPGMVSAIFYQTLRISVVLSVPLAAVVFFDARAFATALLGNAAYAYLFNVLAADILIYAGALPVAIGTLYGLKKFKTTSIIGIVSALLRQCLIILLIIFMKDFVGLIVAWVLADTITVGVYIVCIFRFVGRSGTNFFSVRRLLSFSWPLSIENLTTFGYNWFDRALLVVFVPLASLGVYNAAIFAFTALSGLTLGVNSALLPVYSRISSRGDRLIGCKKATRVASRYVSFTVAPFAFGLLATAKPALTLFVGQAYGGGAEPLMVLCCAFAITSVGVTLFPMLVALSETRLASAITAASGGLGVAAAFVLMPTWGIVGASTARGFSLVMDMVFTLIVLNRKKAVSLDVEAIWKSSVAGIVMAGVLGLSQMIVYSKLLLPIYVILGGITYLVMLRRLKAVKKFDVDLIREYLGSRLGFVVRVLELGVTD